MPFTSNVFLRNPIAASSSGYSAHDLTFDYLEIIALISGSWNIWRGFLVANSQE
jgi:hypothetical protein